MTLDQVYDECMKMKPGERKTFTLDQEPGFGEITILLGKIAVNKHDNTAVSLRRSDLTLSAHCYVPEL